MATNPLPLKWPRGFWMTLYIENDEAADDNDKDAHDIININEWLFYADDCFIHLDLLDAVI